MAILGIQTEYSLLNSNLRINDLVSYIQKYNYPFLSLADKNSLTAAYKINKILLDANIGIRFIPGLKIDFLINNNIYSLDLYPMNNKGYKELLNILLEINFNNKIYDIRELSIKTKNISLVFPIYNIKKNELNLIDILNELCSNLFIGIANDNIEAQFINNEIYEYCVFKNINVVPYHKSLYLEPKDELANTLLNKIANPKYSSDNADYSLYPLAKVKELISDFPLLADGVEKFIKNNKFKLSNPEAKIVEYKGKNTLLELAVNGLKTKLGCIEIPDNYAKRLEYELEIISAKGFNDYFLIVADLINWAKNNDIYIGPGRGSAAASLVSYALNITNINPLKFNLYFERFLNKDRIGMPDIDIDIPDDKRETLINYCIKKYGENHLFAISTFDTFQEKSALRDTLRVYNLNPDLTPLILDGQTDKYNEQLILSKYLIGLPRHTGTHPAGIIFSKNNIKTILPLSKSSQPNLLQTQLESSDLEAMGFLKTDFLGLRNLKIIFDTILEIKKIEPNFDIKKINYNDKLTFELLTSGNTTNVFQFESNGIKDVLRNYKPKTFTDIYTILALYRPGPMDSINEFIARKNGKHFEYITPELKDILKETYGLILYQEQIMQIAAKIAGYSLARADNLRRGISKKKEDLLLKEKENFIKGAIKNSIPEDKAAKIYDYILEFAQYGFNKAHAISYAVISYETAYLKARYLPLYSLSLLNASLGDNVQAVEIFRELKEKGYIIEAPEINLSSDKFIIKNKSIYYPFSIIKGISKEIIAQVIKERSKGVFTSIDDFVSRTNIAPKELEVLINANCFRCFNPNKKVLLKNREENLFIALSGLKPKKTEIDSYTLEEEISIERLTFGFNYFFNQYNYLIELREKNQYNSLSHIVSLNNYLGVISKVIEKISQKNNKYLSVELNDEDNIINCFVFKKEIFNQIKNSINKAVVVSIEVSNYLNKTYYIINNISIINKSNTI